MTDTLAIRGGTPAVPKELHHRWPVITAEDKAAAEAAIKKVRDQYDGK